MFFESAAWKGFSSEGKESQGGKTSKQRFNAAFLVRADGEKFGKPIAILRDKKPKYFRLASAPDKLAEVSYFDDSKSWMQVKIMEKVLGTLNFQMRKERRNVILFLDNATVHPTTLINIYNIT